MEKKNRSINKMASKCQNCPIKDICENKQIEAAAYAAEGAAAPVLRETIQINVGGTMITTYKDEIEKELCKSLNMPFMLNYGA